MVTAFLLSAICFLISIPLGAIKLTQDAVIANEKIKGAAKKLQLDKPRDTAMALIGKKRKKSGKADKFKRQLKVNTAKAIKGAITTLTACLRLLSGILSALATLIGAYEIILIFLLVAVVAIVPVMYGNDDASVTGSSYQSTSLYADTDSRKSKSTAQTSFGGVVVTASIEEMLSWSDTEVWSNLSGNRWSSKKDFTDEFVRDRDAVQEYLDGYMGTMTIPLWHWANPEKTGVVEKVVTVKCNPNLVEYFTNFFTDLHKAPEQYVISFDGCYVFRNISGSPKPSIHCMGAAVDINSKTEGMLYHQTSGNEGRPFKSINDVTEEWMKQEVCTFDNTFHDIVVSYGLDWGGTWKSYDGMHFSFPGMDNSVDKVVFNRSKAEDELGTGAYHP